LDFFKNPDSTPGSGFGGEAKRINPGVPTFEVPPPLAEIDFLTVF
jgi:hypothetical protein